MTRRHTVTRYAPGKLFLAGEYAVVEPGNPAILMAVDQYIGVTVTSTYHRSGFVNADLADVTVVSDLVPDEVRLRWRDGELCGCGPWDEEVACNRLAHVVSAIEVVDALRAQRDLPAPSLAVSVSSRLHARGTKFGLGSSGAVTVATVDSVAASYGMELSPHERFRLAVLATARVDPGPSGGDLAASTWGGWLAYRAPDRAAVLAMARCHGVEEMLREPWPHCEVRQLPPPAGLTLAIGWTGQPASTTSLVSELRRRNWRGSMSHQSFLKSSADCVGSAVRALEQGDREELLDAVRTARQMLVRLDKETQLGIFTDRLTALCNTAEALGGSAKPSGAGGGDCGVALLPAEASADVARLRAAWDVAGIVPLPISSASQKGRVQ
ncbi:phosphomevalonate kinase [Streptomyces sp. NPDC056534]|uniref:phosphomevalonate kinase n=1 Tax=Streptomyces sp. NPDC056534 TaxID=3345857 RepID=UPI0036AC6EBE